MEFDSGYNVMWTNEFFCNSPEVTFTSKSSALGRLEVGLENVIHLTFLEEFLVLLLVPDAPGLRWMFSDAGLTQKIFTVPSATGNMEFPLHCNVNTSFALNLLAWSSEASISSNSSNVCDHHVPFPDSPA